MIDMRETRAECSEHRALLDVEVGWGPPIGERVRIRPDLDDHCPDGAHDGDERGHTGIVVNVRRTGSIVSHTHLVVFDDPHPVIQFDDHGVSLSARHYAVVELEPIQRTA